MQKFTRHVLGVFFDGFTRCDEPNFPRSNWVHQALALAADLALQNAIVGSDSKQLITDISCGPGGCYGAIVREVIATSPSFMNCSFVFEGRA